MPSYDALQKGLTSLREEGVNALLRNVGRFTANRRRRYFRLRAYRRMLRSHAQAMRHPTPEQRFTAIFQQSKSGLFGDVEGISGDGSSMEATENIRFHLPKLFDKFQIRSVFDAPCGDFHWMKAVIATSPILYTGGDIVRELIARNQSVYCNRYIHNELFDVKFCHFDITRDRYPDADLWLCRDCLFHLSYDDAFAALSNFASSNIRFILTSTHKVFGTHNNTDIISGDFRTIDLMENPYQFDRVPLYRFDDPLPPKEMCLWTRQQVAQALRSR